MATYTPFVRPATAERIKQLRYRGAATTQLLQDPTVLLTFHETANVVVLSNVKPIKIREDRPATETVGQALKDEIVTGTATFWADDIDVIRMDHWFRWDERLCTVISPATPMRNGKRKLHFRIDGERPIL